MLEEFRPTAISVQSGKPGAASITPIPYIGRSGARRVRQIREFAKRGKVTEAHSGEEYAEHSNRADTTR